MNFIDPVFHSLTNALFYIRGNYRNIPPYKVGQSCSKCPSGTSCENNLCVTGGSQQPTVKPTTTTTTTRRPTTTTTTTTRRPTTTVTPPVPPLSGIAEEILQPSESEKAGIIRFMDTYRGSVNPTAANMMKVVNYRRETMFSFLTN